MFRLLPVSLFSPPRFYLTAQGGAPGSPAQGVKDPQGPGLVFGYFLVALRVHDKPEPSAGPIFRPGTKNTRKAL